MESEYYGGRLCDLVYGIVQTELNRMDAERISPSGISEPMILNAVSDEVRRILAYLEQKGVLDRYPTLNGISYRKSVKPNT